MSMPIVNDADVYLSVYLYPLRMSLKQAKVSLCSLTFSLETMLENLYKNSLANAMSAKKVYTMHNVTIESI